MRWPQFLQFTPDERRAALALLLFTGGGSLLVELGRRHPEWMPDFRTVQPAGRGAREDSIVAASTLTGLRPGHDTPGGSGTSDVEPLSAAPQDAEPLATAPSTREARQDSTTPHSAPSRRKKKAGPDQPVDVNTAGVDLLTTLPGIGPALAARIVEDRTRNGPYRSLEDLARVRGIGKATLERLEPVVVLGGGRKSPAAE